MDALSAIPGVSPFLRPYPVLEISTGATNQDQGQYAFSISGVHPNQVYEVATQLMEKLKEYPGFATLSSDYFNNTPISTSTSAATGPGCMGCRRRAS